MAADGETAVPPRRTGRVILIRGGGLGDFILALPLLRELRRHAAAVCLVCRPAFRALLPPDCACDQAIDIDSAVAMPLFAPCGPAPGPALADWLHAAEVHWVGRPDRDRETALLRRGAARVFWHDPKPVSPPHFVLRTFAVAGLTPCADVLRRPVLTPHTDRPGGSLWVHPGSGSPRKNWPPIVFARLARAWWDRHHGGVTVSFGEADDGVIAPALDAFAEAGVRPRVVRDVSVAELRDELSATAGLYIGNDSGVSHLAAGLGVPAVVCFRCTDPAIWCPVGNCVVLPGATTWR